MEKTYYKIIIEEDGNPIILLVDENGKEIEELKGKKAISILKGWFLRLDLKNENFAPVGQIKLPALPYGCDDLLQLPSC